MHPNEYQKLAARTECDQTRSLARMACVPMSLTADFPEHSLRAIRLNHSAIGLANEVGEICKQLQKWIYYGQEPNFTNLVEEYGDCLWYIAEGLNALGVNMADVMSANIAKLKARYPDKYTDYHAANRDKEAEQAALSLGEKVEAVTIGTETNLRYDIDIPVVEPVWVECRPITTEDQLKSMTSEPTFIEGQWDDPNTPPADRSGS